MLDVQKKGFGCNILAKVSACAHYSLSLSMIHGCTTCRPMLATPWFRNHSDTWHKFLARVAHPHIVVFSRNMLYIRLTQAWTCLSLLLSLIHVICPFSIRNEGNTMTNAALFSTLLLCIYIQSPPFLNMQHMCNLDHVREYQHTWNMQTLFIL